MHVVLLIVAKYLLFVVGILCFAYWLTVPKQEKIRLAIFGILAGVVTLALVKISAWVYYDPRPFVSQHVPPLYPHAADNGFPSDHTVLAALAALVVYSSSKRAGLALLGLALLIGVARVLGHIHSPIDIIGSIAFALIGFGVATIATPPALQHLGAQREHIPSK